MIMFKKSIFMIAFMGLWMMTANVMADDLGRLFTTPEERIALEKLRHQRPKEIKPPEITIAPPVAEDEAKPDIGGITVNGLVYRENGKSTAWVNNGNTYEGNLENQYLQIEAGNIKPDGVIIEIPLNDAQVQLKAGATYTLQPEEADDQEYNDE